MGAALRIGATSPNPFKPIERHLGTCYISVQAVLFVVRCVLTLSQRAQHFVSTTKAFAEQIVADVDATKARLLARARLASQARQHLMLASVSVCILSAAIAIISSRSDVGLRWKLLTFLPVVLVPILTWAVRWAVGCLERILSHRDRGRLVQLKARQRTIVRGLKSRVAFEELDRLIKLYDHEDNPATPGRPRTGGPPATPTPAPGQQLPGPAPATGLKPVVSAQVDGWVHRIMAGPPPDLATSFALICMSCATHNGLAERPGTIFRCMSCGGVNAPPPSKPVEPSPEPAAEPVHLAEDAGPAGGPRKRIAAAKSGERSDG